MRKGSTFQHHLKIKKKMTVEEKLKKMLQEKDYKSKIRLYCDKCVFEIKRKN